MTNNYIAFMAHIPHSEISFIENDLLEQQEVITYLIGLETSTTVGEHMHFLCCVNCETWYHKWSKRIFKDKYKLKGKAYKIDGNGYPRQYGKLKEIKDLEKMGSYTVKDGNIKTNMPQNEIDNFVEKSHKKNILLTMTYEICEKLVNLDERHFKDYYTCPDHLKKEQFADWLKKKNFFADEGYQNDRKRHLLINIIKLLKEKNVDTITKGKIDAVWHRYITLHFSEVEILNEYYPRLF